MPSLQQMPSELLSSIALFLGRPTYYSKKEVFGDLLSLRGTSKAGEEAVRLATKDHFACDYLSFSCSKDKQVSGRSVAAMSRIFGGRLTHLGYSGRQNGPFPTDIIRPLQDAVLHTQGRLVSLNISFSAITATTLLDMCRASPLLTKLTTSGPALSHLWSNVDEFATMISSACPLLESVNFPTLGGLSKAESYQMHFPKTKCLSLARGGGYVPDPYEPTRWDKIEASARNCEHALELNLHGCWISSELAGVLLRGNLRRVTCLNLEGCHTDIEPATIIQLAAGLESLQDLQLPETITHTPGFYVSLVRARPSLTSIFFGDNSSTIDDACLAAICENLALERLIIDDNSALTPRFVDIILASKSAQTLCDVSLCSVEASTSANVLRLALGCPKLVDLVWYASLTPLADGNGNNVDALEELLESRAKQSSKTTYVEIEVFEEFGPWKSDNWRHRPEHAYYPGPQ